MKSRRKIKKSAPRPETKPAEKIPAGLEHFAGKTPADALNEIISLSCCTPPNSGGIVRCRHETDIFYKFVLSIKGIWKNLIIYNGE